MRMGIIGYGTRMSSLVDRILEFELGAEITAIASLDLLKVKELLEEREIENVKLYSDAEDMLGKEQLDGVLIGTRCSDHTRLATLVLKRNMPLFLEKPVSTTMDQLLQLQEAYQASTSEVVVSFPLRVTPLVQTAKKLIDSGKIGRVEHVQAYNNVPYGNGYYHSWYRDEQETGGLFLQKATHDLDYIHYLLGGKPVEICAMTSKQVFKGNKPVGLTCEKCEEYHSCPESPYVFKHVKYMEDGGNQCCFAVDTGNEDSGSTLIRYETGMHVVYTQNFFVREGAATRGARLIGYKGTIEFDWYKDELKVWMHDGSPNETYNFNTATKNHGGGDSVLALNFIRVMQGKEKSVAPLEDGLTSALLCLKAKESSESHRFEDLSWFFSI